MIAFGGELRRRPAWLNDAAQSATEWLLKGSPVTEFALDCDLWEHASESGRGRGFDLRIPVAQHAVSHKPVAK
jgi:hypothetical protein